MVSLRAATPDDALAISGIGRTAMPVQFDGEPELHRIYIDAAHRSRGVGVEHYRAAGVAFPPDPKPFELIVMRYRQAAEATA